MKTLVFDTCFNKSYIVLRDDEKVLSSEIISSTDSNYHSVFLIPKIRDILKENNIQISDLDAIGVNIGPGSFTGIRAGITIARVLAQQADIKLVGVSSLEILSMLNNTDSKTVVVLDARKNMVYYSEFKLGNMIQEPVLISRDDLSSKIENDDFVITDSILCGDLNFSNNVLNYEDYDGNLGLFLSDIVSNKLTDNICDYNWAKVKPLYLQKPSITKPKEIKI